jgi:predicted nucleic acid-binding protein
MAQAVVDTSPLIALHQIGLLWLFESLYGAVLIPPAVAREAAPSLPELPGYVQMRTLNKPVPHGSYGVVLGDGEAEAIALALEIGGSQVVLDDSRGRAVAARLGLPVVGTLGLLRAAKLSGHIPAVKGPIAALVASRFWVEPALVKALLIEMGEASRG